MNDDFLYSLRREPPPTFASGLHERLAKSAEARRIRPQPVIVAAKALAAAAVVALAFSIPAVRASAQSFLALFRAGTFIGVPVDGRRAAELSRKVDLEGLLGGAMRVIQAPGRPIELSEPPLASAAAGFTVRLPASLPPGASVTRTSLMGASRLQLTPDLSALRLAMDALGITDLPIPPGLEGQVVTLDVSPVVTVQYAIEDEERSSLQLVQARTPEVALPPGVDIAKLGEIGLRVAGLSPLEAHDIARVIDWQTTLLVPIPPIARSFRQVAVGRASGLLIETRNDADETATLLLWSSGGRSYVMKARGKITADQVVEMANSVQ